MPPRPSEDDYIAEARGFTSARAMHAHFETRGYPGQGGGVTRDEHANDLRMAAEIAAVSGDSASLDLYLDLLREGA